MRFYGLGWYEINSMPAHAAEELWQAITVLESQEGLVDRAKSIWGMLTESARKKDHREIWDKAYPRDLYPRPGVSFKEFLKKFQGG